MYLHESIISGSSILELALHGLPLMLVKAWLILFLAHTLYDQYEYSPASIRHRIWLVAFIGLAALPLLTLLLPAWNLVSIDIPSTNIAATTPLLHFADYGPVSIPAFSTFDWIIVIYLLIAFFRLALLSNHVIKVHYLSAKASPANKNWEIIAAKYYRNKIAIKVAKKLTGPVTWGIIQPTILLPVECEQWPEIEKEMIIQHEIGHIKRSDWLSQLLSQVVSVLYWPLPGINKALRLISLEAELASDDTVLKNGSPAADYATLLIRFTKANTLHTTVAMAANSDISQRIRNIISPYSSRSSERKTCRWFAAFGVLLLFPIASIQATGNYLETDPLEGYKLIPVARAKLNDRHSNNLYHCDCRDSAESGRAILKTKPKNTFPKQFGDQNIEGYVDLLFDIDANGEIRNIRVINSNPKGYFDEHSRSHLAQWKYKPAMKLGIPQIQKNEITRINYLL